MLLPGGVGCASTKSHATGTLRAVRSSNRAGPQDGLERVWLRFSTHDVELGLGDTRLGRSPRCEVILDDPLVSREHAIITRKDLLITVRDLGSINGTLINERAFAGARELKRGDRMTIGKQTFELHVLEAAMEAPTTTRKRMDARTLPGVDTVAEGAPVQETTRQAEALELLSGVADKVLGLGRGEEAERILRGTLNNLHHGLGEGRFLRDNIAAKAASYAVRLAEATNKGEWINYCFSLYTLQKKPLPADVVDQLYETLRNVPDVDFQTYQTYKQMLTNEASSFGPSDVFLVRRINGLEELAKR